MPTTQASLVIVVLIGLCVGLSAGVAGAGPPELIALAPNLHTEENVGEYVVVSFSEPVDVSGWRLEDGFREATLPNRTLAGTVVLSTQPAITNLIVEEPVYPLAGSLRLNAEGDELTLRDPVGTTVDQLTYESTDEGEVWHRDGDKVHPRGMYDVEWSHREVGPMEATTFVLPDGEAVPDELLAGADDRIRLAGYEFTDPSIANALVAATERGVDVTVLIDGTPVGGQSPNEVATVEELVTAGIAVRVMEGSRDPYRFHHPKYAIVDDRAIVMTENWKRAGTGGASSRGWGVTVDGEDVVEDLAAVFEADFAGPAAVEWERYRHGNDDTSDTEGPTAEFPTQIEPQTTTVESVRPIIGPAETERVYLKAIEGASESIAIKQVSIGDADFPLLAAAIDAARRGVAVRILLDHSWYVEDDNRALIAELESITAEEAIPLDARIVEPDGAFEKIHAKGVIVDEETVLIGSTNWNNVSLRENREVALLIEDPDAGTYFTEVFDADWEGTKWDAPLDFLAVVVIAWGVAVILARRRVGFDPAAEPEADEER